MLLAASDNPLHRILDSIAELPWAAHAAVGVVMLAGLVLWATGRHVLKPTIGFCSGAAGSLLGLLAVPMIAPDAGVSPLIGALAGGVLGLLAGFLLYKVAVGATFGFSLGGAVALLAVAVLSSPLGEKLAHKSPTPTDTGSSSLAGSRSDPDLPMAPTPALSLSGSGRETAQIRRSSEDFAKSLRYAAEFAWEDLTPKHRWIVIGASAVAAILGVLLGIALPVWAAGAVTALVGAAIWIPAAIWLARAGGAPGQDLLTSVTPAGWAIVWLATASVGLGMQWMGLIKSPAAPKPAPSA